MNNSPKFSRSFESPPGNFHILGFLVCPTLYCNVKQMQMFSLLSPNLAGQFFDDDCSKTKSKVTSTSGPVASKENERTKTVIRTF